MDVALEEIMEDVLVGVVVGKRDSLLAFGWVCGSVMASFAKGSGFVTACVVTTNVHKCCFVVVWKCHCQQWAMCEGSYTDLSNTLCSAVLWPSVGCGHSESDTVVQCYVFVVVMWKKNKIREGVLLLWGHKMDLSL